MSGYLTYQEAQLRDVATLAIERARGQGAEASATARNDGHGQVLVRAGEIEKSERNGRQSLSVTVYRRGRRGSASTAALDREAVERAVDEALLIADHVQPDDGAGLADPAWLARGPLPPLFEPDEGGSAALIDIAFAIDRAASGATAPDGVTLTVNEAVATSGEGRWALATSTGFCRSASYSTYGRWCAMLARDDAGPQLDFAQESERRLSTLPSPERIAADAVARTLARRGARGIVSRRGSVLFDPRTAATLVNELAGALTGAAQYRRSTFLPDPLGSAIAANHVNLAEDPFEPFGMASAGFDSEGVAGSVRPIVENGVARGLFLGSYSARKLGMRSTGNADGTFNLRFDSRKPGGSRDAMLARLGSGLFVTALQGGATDPISGNWTRAVTGFWVEDGAIAHPVQDVTLAGSMPAMMKHVLAVGDDVTRSGAVRTGSILIDDMQVGGGT